MSIPLSPTTVQTDPSKYLHSTLYARRKEYLRPRKIRVKVGTWNVASLGVERALKDWIRDHEKETHGRAQGTIGEILGRVKEEFEGVKLTDRPGKGEQDDDESDDGSIDLYVIALQEVVDVTAPENYLRPTDPKIPLTWKSHAQSALPAGYELIASPQLIGILLLVYASPRILPQLSSVATSTVGTGLLGYVGNKGATGVRVVLGETTRLVFVDCHLAAFQNGVERRNWDYSEIGKKMAFERVTKELIAGYSPEGLPIDNDPEKLDKSDLIIWCGDLNYRIDLPNDEIRQSLEQFVPREFPPTIPSEAPASPQSYTPPEFPAKVQSPKDLQKVIQSLLSHDQLYQQQQAEKSFQRYREGQITFLPTYKYDVGTVGIFDTSEKHRAPSYCDRVIWKMRDEDEQVKPKEGDKEAGDKEETQRSGKLSPTVEEISRNGTSIDLTVDHRPNRPRATTLTVEDEDDGGEDLVVSASDNILPHNPPPPLPEKDTAAYNEEVHSFPQISNNSTSSASDIKLDLITYTSHQSITASDHKPVTAIFSLTFPAVHAQLRAQVHAEVAKEVDRIENERRPVVTVIVEGEEGEEADSDGRDVEMVYLGEVRLGQIQEKKLTIANTGLVPAKFSFKKRPVIDEEFGEEKEAICKNWLDVEFDEEHSSVVNAVTKGVTLQPGEALTAFLKVNITVDDGYIIQALNEDRERLEDILILHVEDGRDMFLPVSGTWLQTCFGRSLLELVTIPENQGGARGFFGNPGRKPTSDGPLYSAPRELYKLTEYLLHKIKDIVEEDTQEGKVVETQKWYSEVGWPFLEDTWGLSYDDEESGDKRAELVLVITENLACDEEFDYDSWAEDYTAEDIVEVMAEVLLGFLGCLTGRVIPVALYETLIKGATDKKAAEEVLETLPTAASSVHANVFIYLTGFISELIAILSTPPAAQTPLTLSTTLTSFPFSSTPTRDSFTSATSNTTSTSHPEFPLKRSSTVSSTTSIISQTSTTTTRSSMIRNTARQALLKQRLAQVFADVIIYKPRPAPKVVPNRQSISMALQQGAGGNGGKKDDEKKRAFLTHFLEF